MNLALRPAALLLAALPLAAEPVGGIDAKALVREVETQYRGKTSHGTARMRIATEHWKRELTMEMWGEGRERFLAVIRQPKKERDTATLKRAGEVWNYLPKIDRLMKIPSSLMGDSWMGSHLTNDDLVKEDKTEELFDLKVLSVEGSTVTIQADPKPDAAVVWGRLVYRIDRERVIGIDVTYFDEELASARAMVFDRVEKVEGRWLPLRMRITPTTKPKESTEILYERIEFDSPLDPDLFSLRSLRKKR
ncbi:MAG: outer membrane lipoprotein-sorting protein [Elusimicrobia bacterium]|nr:outer membrane lipoprotein-sorting protein [Elusimicrobiota bacterium]